MKRKLQILIGAAAASLLAITAQAETPTSSKTDRLNGAAKASDIIGMTVKDKQDETLGKVEDLAVDVESGRITQVILSADNALTAVPPGSLHHDATNKVLHLDADKAKLANAPKFDTSKWAEYSDSDHLSAVYRHFGHETTFNFVQTGDAVLTGMIPAARLGQVQKASKIMGTPVKNLQEDMLGKVDNMLLDLPAGRVLAVIVSSGGFLGMGDELSAVPPAAFRYNTGRDTLQLDASKDMLSSAPHFKSNQWPEFAETSYATGIYQAYKIEPYFTTNVDNTARNSRDNNPRSLTPLDQGNNKADIDTTAQIRREIMAGKNMSMNAQNVKIITNKGQVTLRGPVNNADEKRLIGEIAERIARVGNVDNQLEVKITTTGN